MADRKSDKKMLFGIGTNPGFYFALGMFAYLIMGNDAGIDNSVEVPAGSIVIEQQTQASEISAARHSYPIRAPSNVPGFTHRP